MGFGCVPVLFCLMSILSGNNCVLADKRKDGKCNNDATYESECCVNYFYNASSNRCEECIGSIGVNCNRSCPDGFFGKQCLEKCFCMINLCDKISGCRNSTSGTFYKNEGQDRICHPNASNEGKCCANYLYNASSNQCEECIGGYGVNCDQRCPAGFFGRRCNEECFCSVHFCDKISGCWISTPETFFQTIDVGENGQTFGGILWIALYVTLATLAVLGSVLLIVVYRVKTTKRSVFPGEVDNETTINDVLSGSQSSVTYAEVARTSRGPIRAIEQNDVMYGNVLKFNQQENGKKQEINDLYSYGGDVEGEFSATKDTYSVCCPLNTTELVVYSEVRKEKETTKGNEIRSEDR